MDRGYAGALEVDALAASMHCPARRTRLAFYVGRLGLEVHTDAQLEDMRWLTVNVRGQPEREIILMTPGPRWIPTPPSRFASCRARRARHGHPDHR